jgi:hypothetical protein
MHCSVKIDLWAFRQRLEQWSQAAPKSSSCPNLDFTYIDEERFGIAQLDGQNS